MSKRKYLRRLSSAALLSMALYAHSVSPIWAKEVDWGKGPKMVRMERRVEKKEEMEEAKKEKINQGAVVRKGELVVSGSEYSLEGGEKLDLSTAKIMGRFGTKLQIGDLKDEDEVMIVGKYAADGKTIEVKLLRDMGVMVRNGEYWGKVVTKTDGSVLTIQIKKDSRKIEILSLDGAKKVDRQGKEIILSEVVRDHEVKVKGLVDKTDDKVWKMTKVYKLIDRSLPVK